jgi:hypothetical protein
MPSFKGVYQHERGDVQIEFNQRDNGSRWHVVAKNGMTRREVSIWEPADPWQSARNLVADVLNASQADDVEPPRYDLNQKLPRQVSSTVVRRRGQQDTGLPPWRPPEAD